MEKFFRTAKWLEKHVEEVLLVLLLTYMSCCMILQIFMRHVMHASLSWSEESIRYAFIWLIFLGFGLAIKEDRHISISFFRDLLPERIRFFISILVNVMFFVYAALMLYYGVEVVGEFMASGQTSPALGIPKYLVFLAAPVGFGLVIIRLIQRTIILIRDKK